MILVLQTIAGATEMSEARMGTATIGVTPKPAGIIVVLTMMTENFLKQPMVLLASDSVHGLARITNGAILTLRILGITVASKARGHRSFPRHRHLRHLAVAAVAVAVAVGGKGSGKPS